MNIRKKCYQREIRESFETNDSKSFLQNLDLSPANAVVKTITQKESKSLILQYEWLKTFPRMSFLQTGLFFDNILAATEVFIKTKAGGVYSLFKKPAICLARGCCTWFAPNWCSSFLIGKSIKILDEIYKQTPIYLVAYSDWEAGELGTVYQASNWYYLGHKKNPEWRDTNNKRHDHNHHRDIAKKQNKEYFKTHKKLTSEMVANVKMDLLNLGWKRETTMRGSYATVIGYRSKEKNQFIQLLKEKSVIYPKNHKGEKNEQV